LTAPPTAPQSTGVDPDLIGYLDQRFGEIERRFDDVDQRFADVDRRFGDADRQFEELRRHFDVVAESLMSKIELVGEGVRTVDQNHRAGGLEEPARYGKMPSSR